MRRWHRRGLRHHVWAKPITLLFLLLVGSSCLFFMQHMKLDEEIKTESERSSTFARSRFSFSMTNRTLPQGQRRRRRSIIRRWDAWNNESSSLSKRNIPGGRCKIFKVLFDRAPLHGCIVSEQVKIPFCRLENFRIDVTKIESAMGGEDLNSVMGRVDILEYPKYHPGALTISRPVDVVPRVMERSTFHYIRDVLSALTVRPLPTCAERWTGTTLFLTRYEYANLYHTTTDFFSAFFSVPNDDKLDAQVNLVFLDAHAKGNMDSVWQDVFGNVTFVKSLPKGGVCFERAIFIPSGNVSPLLPWIDHTICPNPIMMEDFSNHFLISYGLEHVRMQRGKIVVIDRVPYISHPRSKPNIADRAIQNMKHLPAYLQTLPNVQSVSLVHLEELTFREQLRVVREAHILIGNHGAGLTHLIFMSDGSHVIEFDRELGHFIVLSKWKPRLVHHIAQPVNGSLSADYIQKELLPTIASILEEPGLL